MIPAHTYKCRYLFRIHNNSFDNSVKNHGFMNSSHVLSNSKNYFVTNKNLCIFGVPFQICIQ